MQTLYKGKKKTKVIELADAVEDICDEILKGINPIDIPAAALELKSTYQWGKDIARMHYENQCLSTYDLYFQRIKLSAIVIASICRGNLNMSENPAWRDFMDRNDMSLKDFVNETLSYIFLVTLQTMVLLEAFFNITCQMGSLNEMAETSSPSFQGMPISIHKLDKAVAALCEMDPTCVDLMKGIMAGQPSPGNSIIH